MIGGSYDAKLQAKPLNFLDESDDKYGLKSIAYSRLYSDTQTIYELEPGLLEKLGHLKADSNDLEGKYSSQIIVCDSKW